MFKGIKRIFKRGRKYPLKRDEDGLSARQRAFADFDEGKKPSDVVKHVEISKRTANRYYASWKKLPPDFNSRYKELKKGFKEHPELLDMTINFLCQRYKIPHDEAIVMLQRPYGTKKIVRGDLEELLKEGKKQQRDKRIKSADDFLQRLELLDITKKDLSEALDIIINKRFEKNKQGHI